jgi:hypothetical protein
MTAIKDIIIKRINEGNFYFSSISLLTSILLLIIIISQKQLHSLTYIFLMAIFISEILNSIGNMIKVENKDEEILAPLYIRLMLLSLSDLCTYILFLEFSYCSIKVIKEANKTIKKQIKKFIIIPIIISFAYSIIVILLTAFIEESNKKMDIRFKDYYYNDDKSQFNNIIFYYVLSCIHLAILVGISFFIFMNIFKVLMFMKEKLMNDKVNSKKIVKLYKNLLRYALICILYWIFMIPRICAVSVCDEDNLIRDIIYLFSESLLNLRGFLIGLNTLMNSKIQKVIDRFFQVKIKYYLLLNFKRFSIKRVKNNKKNDIGLLPKND